MTESGGDPGRDHRVGHRGLPATSRPVLSTIHLPERSRASTGIARSSRVRSVAAETKPRTDDRPVRRYRPSHQATRPSSHSETTRARGLHARDILRPRCARLRHNRLHRATALRVLTPRFLPRAARRERTRAPRRGPSHAVGSDERGRRSLIDDGCSEPRRAVATSDELATCCGRRGERTHVSTSSPKRCL